MSKKFEDDLEKAKNANSEVRRAVREGSLELGMDANQKVQTVLTHLERYEEGLMERVERDTRELKDALDKFRNDIEMEKDELHKMDDSIARWNRATIYLDFLEDRIKELDQERKERAAAAATSEDEEGDDGSDVPDELEINTRRLRSGNEPFALDGLDLDDIHHNTYGFTAVEEDLGFIYQKSLAPVAGEIEEEENFLYKGLDEVVEAMKDAADTHNHLLEVKEILARAEEDDDLLRELEEKDIDSKIKDQIGTTLRATGDVEDTLDHLLDKEREMIDLVREAHELVKHQIDLDEEFLSKMDNELGNSKWWGFRKTGLYKRLDTMRGRSSELDRELDYMVETFDEMRKILDNVQERKQGEERKEEKVLSKVESYLNEYSDMMESS